MDYRRWLEIYGAFLAGALAVCAIAAGWYYRNRDEAGKAWD